MTNFELDDGSSLLRMIPKENTIILKYNPGKVLRPYKRSASDEQHYEKDLEFIKRRIDWCIRTSDGQNPDINEFPKLPQG